MSLDPDTIAMIRDSLDAEYPDAEGTSKKLRYFTAADCRVYAARNPATGELADVIDQAELATLGEALARLEALDEDQRCPRCSFEHSVANVVYCGEFIETHYEDGQNGRLNESELALVALCRDWLADDAIERCLAEEA